MASPAAPDSPRAHLKALVAATRPRVRVPAVPSAWLDGVERLREHLMSDESLLTVRREPYWPRFTSPWWMMLLLHEMGEADAIPQPPLKLLVSTINTHYPHLIARTLSDVPDDVEPERGLLCACAAGLMWGMLAAAEVHTDKQIPWMRHGLHRNQRKDGGLTCDLKAGDKASSSLATTLPALESTLWSQQQALEPGDDVFMERGSRFVLRYGLCGAPAEHHAPSNVAGLAPAFPRLGAYDALRGLRFVTTWASKRQQVLDASSLLAAVQLVADRVGDDGAVRNGQTSHKQARTWARSRGEGWSRDLPARSFDLLELVGQAEQPSPYLTRELVTVLDNLALLERAGLIR